MNILVVEDQACMGEHICRALREQSHAAMFAQSRQIRRAAMPRPGKPAGPFRT